MTQPARNDFTAMFSPSVARIAASTARDWSFVDSWLASKFPDGRSVPDFERNPSTLKVLLAVASMNESADESRNLVAHADRLALEQRSRGSGYSESHVQHLPDNLYQPPFPAMSTIRDNLLSTISDYINTDGKAALDSLGNTAVQNGNSLPDPEELGTQVMAMQNNLLETLRATLRADAWRAFLLRETRATADYMNTLRDPNYKLPPELAKQNMDLQRKTRALVAQLSDAQDRSPVSVSSAQNLHPTIQLVAKEEERFLAILCHKKELDAQMKAFEGLPSDTGKARDEIESLRQNLSRFTSRRDQVFEGLVEQESPVKRR